MIRRLTHLAALTTLSLVLGVAGARAQVSVMPAELEGVDVKEQLDKPLPKDAVFRDHEGKSVRLGDYFDGKKPVVLTLAYANCKVVCSMVLGAEADVLKQQEWLLGKEYRAVTISIDPRDTPAIAAKKRSQMLALYGREGQQWDFLVGDAKNIERVAKAVGYQYKWDARQEQFAHPAVLMITKPNGDLARYLYGLSFEPQDVRLGLLEASHGRSISTIEKMILYCYMYDPIGAKYVLVAKNVMRVAGAITVVVLGAFLALMWRRELRKKRAHEASKQDDVTATKGTARARA
ncbi:MAG TPA: SCO family protein [Polyangiales bacterium]|nr:SCO family protein [Polyangiales bacterium]